MVSRWAGAMEVGGGQRNGNSGERNGVMAIGREPIRVSVSGETLTLALLSEAYRPSECETNTLLNPYA